MADLHTPKSRLVIAKLELQIEQQRLVKEQRDLRRSEIADERQHVEADITTQQERMAATAALYDETPDKATTGAKTSSSTCAPSSSSSRSLTCRRCTKMAISCFCTASLVASDAHIAKLEAEVGQQNDLMKNTENEGHV
jgi:hypothetical protein